MVESDYQNGRYALLYLFRSTGLVFAGSLLMMCGYLSGMAVFGAVFRKKEEKQHG